MMGLLFVNVRIPKLSSIHIPPELNSNLAEHINAHATVFISLANVCFYQPVR